MTRVRNDVIAALRKRIDDAEKRGDDSVAAVKRANEELATFMATGAWPDMASLATLRSRAGAAADSMNRAYTSAMGAYGKAGLAELAAAVTSEAEHFERQSDVVPWGENLVEDEAEASRRLRPGENALTVRPDLDGEYRIEVVATLDDADGTLEIEAPLADEDKRVTLVSVAQGGNGPADRAGAGARVFKMLVSVYEGLIGADLGVQRPIDISGARAGTSRDVVVRAVGSGATITSIRVKPIMPGAPEQVTKKAKAKPNEPAKKTKPDPFVLNAEWHGEWDGAGCVIKVVERDGGFVAIRIERGNGAWWRIEGRADGNRVIVTDIKRTRNPGNDPSILVKEGRGTVSCRNGRVSIHCNAKYDGRGARNKRISIDISNAGSR
jgi:hypothetical protein